VCFWNQEHKRQLIPQEGCIRVTAFLRRKICLQRYELMLLISGPFVKQELSNIMMSMVTSCLKWRSSTMKLPISPTASLFLDYPKQWNIVPHSLSKTLAKKRNPSFWACCMERCFPKKLFSCDSDDMKLTEKEEQLTYILFHRHLIYFNICFLLLFFKGR